ncbi:MAG: putative toxin-antitoxin system toxin component, PIN family [Betaproteobacteria bacterium]
MKVVLDTNVLIAAVRSRQGASFSLLSLLPDARFQIALGVALYTEWQDVMSRPEHWPPGMGKNDALAFLHYLLSVAHLQDVYYLWRPFLRDPDDDMVLECAVASGSQYVVTHNVRDFQKVGELGLQVATPAQFLDHLRRLP